MPAAQSSIDEVSAPDCETSASGPGLGQRPDRAGIELQLRALEAEAVRAQQVDALAPRDPLQVGRLRRRRCRCETTSAERQAMRPASSSAAAHVLRRQRDDGEVGARLRQVGQRAAGVDVQEVERAGVALGAQRRVQRAGVRGLAAGVVGLAGEDHDRLGREQRSQIVFVHVPGVRSSSSRAAPRRRGLPTAYCGGCREVMTQDKP